MFTVTFVSSVFISFSTQNYSTGEHSVREHSIGDLHSTYIIKAPQTVSESRYTLYVGMVWRDVILVFVLFDVSMVKFCLSIACITSLHTIPT